MCVQGPKNIIYLIPFSPSSPSSYTTLCPDLCKLVFTSFSCTAPQDIVIIKLKDTVKHTNQA